MRAKFFNDLEFGVISFLGQTAQATVVGDFKEM